MNGQRKFARTVKNVEIDTLTPSTFVYELTKS